ncbi:TPA: hypothetical protein DCX16_06935 [bacterium]|nr:hypothetical protein [bacterium]
MTKKDLAGLVSEEIGLDKKDSMVVVNSILSGIMEILKEKKRVEIRGFGSFNVVQRKAKKGRIIKTASPIFIPPYKTVVFIPGINMKNL